MNKKPAQGKDEKPQRERFIEKARELGADESEDALDRAFKRIVPSRKPSLDQPDKRVQKSSDVTD